MTTDKERLDWISQFEYVEFSSHKSEITLAYGDVLYCDCAFGDDIRSAIDDAIAQKKYLIPKGSA